MAQKIKVFYFWDFGTRQFCSLRTWSICIRFSKPFLPSLLLRGISKLQPGKVCYQVATRKRTCLQEWSQSKLYANGWIYESTNTFLQKKDNFSIEEHHTCLGFLVYVYLHVYVYGFLVYVCMYMYFFFNCFDSEFCKHIWTKWKLARRAAWHVERDECGGVFWLVKKTTCQSGSSTELTIIYSKVFVSCSCHSFPKPVKNPGFFYCTISLYIYTCYLDVAMRYLDVTKEVG